MRARARVSQLPELNRIKQSLHMSQVSYARMANDALLVGWDPELEYDMHTLMSSWREVSGEEADIDGYGDPYMSGLGINLNRRSEPSTPATPRSRSECATPAPMDVDEENVPPHSASGREVCSLEFN